MDGNPLKILRSAQAGSLESQDILITVKKGKSNTGIDIQLDSPSSVQYGRKIRTEIESIISSYGIKDASVQAIDKGALGFTVKARTEAAILRACNEEEEL